MGLTTKALNLLRATANSSELARGIVVDRVLYWLNTLMTGITIKSRENRQEIAEEAIECLPTWMRLAEQMEKTDSNQLVLKRSFIDLFANLKALEEFCNKDKLLTVCYECGATLVQEMLSINQEFTNADIMMC